MKSIHKMKIKCILLRTSGSIVEKTIDSSLDINNISLDPIKNLFKKIGKNSLERHCDYDMNDYVISIFGWKNGKAGNENKTDLPPPEDMDIYFGDILVIKSTSLNDNYDERKLVSLSKEEYEDFIEKAFGGFESLGEEDTDTDNDQEDKYDSDDSFIVNSDDIEEIDRSSYEEEEFRSEDETSEEEDLMSLQSDTDDSSELNSSKDDTDSSFNSESSSSKSDKSKDD